MLDERLAGRGRSAERAVARLGDGRNGGTPDVRGTGHVQHDGRMIDHLGINCADLEAAKAFYDAVLGTLGVPAGAVDRHRVFWRTPAGVFSVSLPIDGQPATIGNGGTIGFACTSAEQADAWFAAGMANGGSACEDPPGVRAGANGRVYLAYLRDPDGNKICGLYRMPQV